MNGTQCGSPALRRRRHCFFHERIRREHARIAADAAHHAFDLPLLEDANSVQMALMKVIQMLGSGRLDHKTAGLMLYALQTASSNLRHATFEVNEPTDVVIDRDDVHRTCIDGPQWFEEDFEDRNGSDEAATDDEAGDEQEENKQAANEEAEASGTDRNPREGTDLRPPPLPTGRNRPTQSQMIAAIRKINTKYVAVRLAE
jgi:hypothetical protein